MKVKMPKSDPSKERLKELCWHAYKTSRIVFAKKGNCGPVLMCEVEQNPAGKKRTGIVVCNVPMDHKDMAVKFLTDKFRLMKPLRYAFVSEVFMTAITSGKKAEKTEGLMCQGSDKDGNYYHIAAEIEPTDNPGVKKLTNEICGFIDSGTTMWGGLFE